MHKVLITLLLIFFSINLAQATEWKEVDNSKIYYDYDSVEYGDKTVRFWAKFNSGNSTLKCLYFLNIPERQITIEQYYEYSKNGTLINSNKTPFKTRVIPDSMLEIYYHYFEQKF